MRKWRLPTLSRRLSRRPSGGASCRRSSTSPSTSTSSGGTLVSRPGERHSSLILRRPAPGPDARTGRPTTQRRRHSDCRLPGGAWAGEGTGGLGAQRPLHSRPPSADHLERRQQPCPSLPVTGSGGHPARKDPRFPHHPVTRQRTCRIVSASGWAPRADAGRTNSRSGDEQLRVQGDDLAAGPDRHVVERFTRRSDDIIEYSATVMDPSNWTRPWTVVVPWRAAEGPLFEYACHEGNYSMTNLLKASRAVDAER